MKKAGKKDLVILVLFLAALVAFSPMARAAGSLEPSAPPGPVMKSLDEVEPRIPIKASDLPLTITQRGSYYLTQDVNFTDTAHHAITVECNEVTIDLKGYTIAGPNSTSYSGIYMNNRTNVEILNGTVRDFYVGVYEIDTAGRGHRVINIRAISNTAAGMFLNSSGNLVKDCTAVENANSYGIYVYANSTVTGNTASYNGYHGILASSGCTLTGNIASYNNGGGIICGDCTVTGNTATYNSSFGISVYYRSTVTGNTANYNKTDGIVVQGANNVIGNNCSTNGYNGDGAGIHAEGGYNRIEGNHVSSNDRGIDIDNPNNLIVKNSAVGNTVEYDIVVNNKVGTISTDPTTATAWANFDF